MKHITFLTALTIATPAIAAEKTIRLDDANTNFAAALGKQVTLVFAPDLRAKYFSKVEYPNATLTDVTDAQVCFYGRDSGLDPDDAKLKAIARDGQGDMCVGRGEVSVKYDAQEITGAPPEPFFQTDATNCKWAWKTGRGIGIWAEDCKFDTGLFVTTYDEKIDSFVQSTDGADPYPVLRQFHKKADEGPDALLPELKAAKLIPDDDECKFEPSEATKGFGTWTTYDIMPQGKRKAAFDAAPSDEIPDPPCGDVGLAVDFQAYFMIDSRHPDRVIYVNLGQDGSMFDPFSISLF